MKKILSVILIFAFIFTLISCDAENSGKDILNPYFTGKVLEIYEKSCLVEVSDTGNGHFAVGNNVVVSTDIPNCPTFTEGDYLTISFDGIVAESYPPQVMNVYIITKITDEISPKH